MKEFKVGNKVFDLRFGNGHVERIEDKTTLCVFCAFDNGLADSYTMGGLAGLNHKFNMLYHGHDLIVEVKEPEYEYQILFKNAKDKSYQLTSTFYKGLDGFKNGAGRWDCFEVLEISKRLVK